MLLKGLVLWAVFAVVQPLDMERAGSEIHRAVIRSDMKALSSIRERLKRAMEGAEGPALAQLRFAFAHVSWRLSAGEERGSKPYKELLESADDALEELLDDEPENAEAQALYGTVNGWLITGMWSGMRRGPRSSDAYERARALAPENPRVVMHQGVSRLFRPGMFGGGLDKAEAELTEALELFEKEPRDKPWPNFGHVEIRAWMGQVMYRKAKLGEARAFYEEALELEPEYKWVLEVLVPQLEAAEAKAQQKMH